MKPILEKTKPESEFRWRYNLLEILVCPKHPKIWCQNFTENGEYPDTTDFCDCCTGDCDTPYCKSCSD